MVELPPKRNATVEKSQSLNAGLTSRPTMENWLRSLYPSAASDSSNGEHFAEFDYEHSLVARLYPSDPPKSKSIVAKQFDDEEEATVKEMEPQQAPDSLEKNSSDAVSISSMATTTAKPASISIPNITRNLKETKDHTASPWDAQSAVLYARKMIAGWRAKEFWGGEDYDPSKDSVAPTASQVAKKEEVPSPEPKSQQKSASDQVVSVAEETTASPEAEPQADEIEDESDPVGPDSGTVKLVESVQATSHRVESVFQEQSVKQYGPPPACPANRLSPGDGKLSWVEPRNRKTGRNCDKNKLNQPLERDECETQPEAGHGHADPRCYIASKFRFVMRPAAAVSDEESAPSTPKKNVAITIMGELQRIDRKSTIASHVVAPYSKSGHRVTVFLTLQTRRAKVPSEWHPERFKNLPEFNDQEEVEYARDLAQLFLNAGAKQVIFHGYTLTHLPLLMPSRPGGDGRHLRFRSSHTSYTLHCLTRSAVLHDMLRHELVASGGGADFLQKEHQLSSFSGPDPGIFDAVLEIRGDAYWAEMIPSLESLNLSKIHVKACLAWKGVNDKFAVIPRKYAVQWMDLLGAYYNDTLASMGGYWNSEEMSYKLSLLHGIPVEKHKDSFSTMDYNYWNNANMSRFIGKQQPPGPKYGCFPKLYYHNSCFKPQLKSHFESHICPAECKKFKGKCIDGSDGLGGVPSMQKPKPKPK
jgi:hypothetical protein